MNDLFVLLRSFSFFFVLLRKKEKRNVVLNVHVLLHYRFPIGKAANKFLHVMWHSIGLVSMGFGLAAVWRSHDHPHGPVKGKHTANLSNPHAMFGIMTVSLTCFQYSVGLITFLAPNVAAWLKKEILPNHVLLGIAVYVMGGAGIVSGASQEALAKLMCDYYKNMEDRDYFDDDASWLKNSSYTLTERDANPAEHYHLLPDGCKVISGVALCAGMTVLCTVFAVLSIKVGAQSDTIGDDKKKDNISGSISARNLTDPLIVEQDVSQSLA